MTRLVVHHDCSELPPGNSALIPVHLYGLGDSARSDISLVGHPVIRSIRRLGVPVSPEAFDFLSIAMAVTAADTFVLREDAADGWAREISVRLPLNVPDKWEAVRADLEQSLRFLSGDLWHFEFVAGGLPPPTPMTSRYGRQLIQAGGRDGACLFSGGVDSTVGVLNLLSEGRSPLLISHAYRGDASRQERILSYLPGQTSRLAVNADPRCSFGQTDITMRTRSLNFLAFGLIGAEAVSRVNGCPINLVVPENGFISLNAPLTTRRIGSLSTRTTHPFFIGGMQRILHNVGLSVSLRNPYQFETKGEMVQSCRQRGRLQSAIDHTVSCSHWKRTNRQCGVCVPCVIRRAALHTGGVNETNDYHFPRLQDVLREHDKRDDLIALSVAIRAVGTRDIATWISESGPLDTNLMDDYADVFSRGLSEIQNYLQHEGVG